MAKSGRPFLNASRRRVETLDGTGNKTMSALTGDSNPQGTSSHWRTTGGTSLESGETYIITGDAAGARTITLPAASRGAYVKIIWGVSTTSASGAWTITTQAGDFINGRAAYFDSDGNVGSNNIAGQVFNGSSHISITVHDDIQEGSMISFMSDGSEWFTMESHIISDDSGSLSIGT